MHQMVSKQILVVHKFTIHLNSIEYNTVQRRYMDFLQACKHMRSEKAETDKYSGLELFMQIFFLSIRLFQVNLMIKM